MKEQNVNDDGCEEGEGERDVAIDQEQDRRDELEEEYDNQIMGDKKRSHELTGGSGRKRRGQEVKKAVHSEGKKDEAKKETGNANSDLLVKFVCSIFIILTSI